jgi:hypothetical protein
LRTGCGSRRRSSLRDLGRHHVEHDAWRTSEDHLLHPKALAAEADVSRRGVVTTDEVHPFDQTLLDRNLLRLGAGIERNHQLEDSGRGLVAPEAIAGG